jgi:hypothetical protein
LSLRLFQRVIWTLEIRTRKLPIPVQKWIIERTRLIVVMRDVAFGGRRKIVLIEPSPKNPHLFDGAHPPNGCLDFDIAHYYLQQTVKVIAVNRNLPVRIALPPR